MPLELRYLWRLQNSDLPLLIPLYNNAYVQFELFPLRFHFIAHDSIYFPPGKATNILRGAFGTIFRQLTCIPQCHDSRTCQIRSSCPYAQVFEPIAVDGPSGLADSPRPFVFRGRHLDGKSFSAGQRFSFDLNVVSRAPEVLAYFVLTFASLGREGLGSSRGRCDLVRVERLDAHGSPAELFYEEASGVFAKALSPITIDLGAYTAAPDRIRVEFLTPTELKHEHRVVDRPEFGILFGRIRDRISTLRQLYGPGPLDIDFAASKEKAAIIRLVDYRFEREEAVRRSSRTGQSHSVGGYIGYAEYEGECFAEFLPYLEAARYTGVGRQSVWGKGEIYLPSTSPVQSG